MRLLLVLVLLATSTLIGHAAPTRAEMTARLAKIKPGMTADQVKQLVGAPDDIKTERDPGGITAARTVEIWRYGTHGHGTFATFGAVHIQADHKVQYVFGGGGTPLATVPEPELQRLLELLAAVPSYNDRLEPLALVRAVNALHPLGKARALDVVDEFLRVSSWLDDPGREGVFLVMRVLFEVPAGGMPAMAVGAPSPAPPNDPTLLPRFPIVMIGDLPLKLVGGYMLAGHPQHPEDDVAAFRKVGTLRARPLAPAVTALADLDAFLAGPIARQVSLDRTYLMDQALRFFGTVYRPAQRAPDAWILDAKQWATHRAAIAKLAPTWNPNTQQMEDRGKVLPPLPPPAARVWWDLGLPKARARVTFQRLDDALVQVELRVEGVATSGAVRLLAPATNAELGTLAWSAQTGGGMVTSQRLALPKGRSVQPVLASGARGPVLAP